MELAAEIQDLITYLPNLPTGKLSFATSLINQFSRKGTLSPAQTPYVTKLRAEAMGIDTPQGPQQISVGDLSGLIALFKTARTDKADSNGKITKGLKWPKIKLVIDGTVVFISLAGDKSKAPGSISLQGPGEFPSRPWYGRISPDGKFDPSRSLTPEFSAALVPVLQELSTNPMTAVQAYGKLTGSCMLCNKRLEDERSKAIGMGETCAKNWGMHDQWKQAAK